ncbi:MAG: sporulation protein YqfD [Faecousia sp.]
MLFDRVNVRLVSSDIPSRFHYISSRGIILYNIQQIDFLTASFTVSRSDYLSIRQYLEEKGDTLTTISHRGPGKILGGFIRRPILSLTIVALLFLTLWIPTRVLFVRVEGNQAVPQQQILQSAEVSGIRFGAGVRGIRSEKVKNSLLQQIPQLSWVGVNTKGCVATITVAERQTADAIAEEETRISSLAASQDAQITDITVTAGSALVKPGDVVSKGQILISGYTDCGIKIHATHAKGEVFGKTLYDKQLLFPSQYAGKGALLAKNKNIFLQIGKKEIKLWKDSGISGAVCDKMYASYYLTLPGGFVLPFGIQVETCVYYRPDYACIAPEQAQPMMESQARAYLVDSMISGQILSQAESFSEEDGVYRLTGRYVCREMVGRIQYEEIGAYHEQSSRKDRKR